jgi:phosphoglycerate dehydrogenase-like enzyme
VTHLIAFLGTDSQESLSVLRKVAPSDLEIRYSVSDEPEDTVRAAAGADAFIVTTAVVSRKVIAAAPGLRFIQKRGVGVDNIDLDAAAGAGVTVAITAGRNAIPVAEHTLMLMLAASRRLPEADRSVREGRWLKASMRSVCYQLNGKTIGLVGLGNVGRSVARLLQGFDVDISYYDIDRADLVTEWSLGVAYADLDELLARSDILSLHIPLTLRTRNIIDQTALARMKPGVILVNAARGGLVDERALIAALESGHVRAAGIDTYDREPPDAASQLMSFDNVVFTPHTGGAVFDNVENTARHMVENVMRALSGKPVSSRDIVVPPAARGYPSGRVTGMTPADREDGARWGLSAFAADRSALVRASPPTMCSCSSQSKCRNSPSMRCRPTSSCPASLTCTVTWPPGR